jgi:poly(hydroxyalkanoate) depolymerase family esterase
MKNFGQRLRVRRVASTPNDDLLSSADGSLRYRLFVPHDVGSRPLPLVVALHGCTQTAADFAVGTRFDEVAGARGAIVLYPQQNKSANGQACWNWFLPEHQTRDRGEPAAILRLVDEISKRYPIDPNRRYVVGLSAGGGMAAILGEQAPDVFSGVGIMAGVALHSSHDVASAFAAMSGKSAAQGTGIRGLPVTAQLPGAAVGSLHPLVAELTAGLRPVMAPLGGGASSAPAKAVAERPPSAFARTRVMIWTGTDDHTVSPQNATTLAHQYCELLGLDAAQGEPGPGRSDAEIVEWRDPGGRVRIERWTVNGMGHVWSGGDGRGSFTYPNGPDASAEMMRLFTAATPEA